MRILGIDPGMRYVGLCWLYRETGRPPVDYSGPRVARAGKPFGPISVAAYWSAYGPDSVEMWATTTWRRHLASLPAGDREDVLWIATVAGAIAQRLRDDAGAIDLVAIEDFTHRPYLRRAITNAPRMGELVGRLFDRVAAAGLPVIRIPAEVTKAGTGHARKWHRNGHEYSAWAVANAASSQVVRRTYA